MNFTPKRNNGNVRALYLGLLALGVILITVSGQFANTRRIAFICISMVSLVCGVYLMMRYELTTFTYTNNASCKTNVLVFANSGHYDAVIIERDEAYDEYLKNAIALVKEKKAQGTEEDDDE